jgi:small subunit ribosomal protein S21
MYGVTDTKGGTENIERMLRRFKRVAESAGVLADLKKRRSFEKPSEKKRRKYKDAIRKAKLDLMPPRRRKRKEKQEERRDRYEY